MFQEKLHEAVGDQIALDFFPNAILGNETDAIQHVKMGVIDMMIQNSGVWTSLCPEIGVFDLCYLFDSEDHQARAMDGNAGTVAGKLLFDRTGVSTLAWTFHISPRSLFTKAPVKSMADLKGVKIRVFATKVFIDGWQIMGTVPTPVPFNELYSALQTGVVEGFENDYGSVIGMKLYEQTKYCFVTQHEFMAMCSYIGKPSWDRIPADLHQPFLRAADATTAAHRVLCKQKSQAAMEELKRLGVTFTPMAAEERKGIAEQMATRLWTPFAASYPATKPIIDGIAAARSA
jgi:tripartite ATP-independent transporter DctP family solute receptor